MIPKQWFEEQGVKVKEYTWYTSYTVKLITGNREIELSKSEKNGRITNTSILLFEYETYLAIYEVDYFNELEVKTIIKNWLENLDSLETIKSQFAGNIELTHFYEPYKRYGKDAMRFESWERAKKYFEDEEELKSQIGILYELCSNSVIYCKFHCIIDATTITFAYTHKYDNLKHIFMIEITEQETFLVRELLCPVNSNTENIDDWDNHTQEFPTPHEAVAYLETLLAEHLKNA